MTEPKQPSEEAMKIAESVVAEVVRGYGLFAGREMLCRDIAAALDAFGEKKVNELYGRGANEKPEDW